MKKTILVFFASFLFVYGKAQYVTIPDTAFANWLQTYYPFCMNGNMLDTTCSTITGETGITISNPNIVNLYGLRYFYSLIILDVSYCTSLTTLDNLPSGLFTLGAIDCPLTTLPPLPQGLSDITLRNANITSWPVFPQSLSAFICDNCGLTSLPALPATLWQLRVFNNSLTSIPPGYNGLSALGVSGNQLTSLPPLSSGLLDLKCANNQLTSIPALPSNLYGLDCAGNQLTALPALPPLLGTLICDGNNLNTLPVLPQNLGVLFASGNNLTSLPSIPASLSQLDVSSNQLSALPVLPATMSLLKCANNLLTQIDSFPRNLFLLDCSSNQLTCLPQLPDPAGFLSGTVLPNPLQCLPNYTAWMTSQPALLSMPLCLPSNPGGCPVVNAVYGAVYDDLNSDCIFSVSDAALQHVTVRLLNSAGSPVYQSSTTASGAYGLPSGSPGNFTLQVDQSTVPFLSSSCPGGFSQNISLTGNNPVVQGLNVEAGCTGSYDPAVLSVLTTGMVFPAQLHQVRVLAGDLSSLTGFPCGAGQSGQVTVTISGPVSYAGILPGAQTPVQSGTTFTYTVSNYGTFDLDAAIGLEFRTDSLAQIGDTVCVSVTVTGTGTDVSPGNNVLNYCYPVTNSYDPNQKEVFPGVVSQGYNGWYTYTVHFQNNGTAPALNIAVADQLSNLLDSSSFQFLAASHAYNWSLSGRKLNVYFPNIQLTDSATNYAASQGWFQFRIKPAGNYPFGTIIPNSAAIYFDFNAPIITNTALVNYNGPIGIAEPVVELPLRVFPNPAAETITAVTSVVDGSELRLYSPLGGVVYAQQVMASATEIDLRALAAGVYVLELRSGNAVRREKVILVH